MTVHVPQSDYCCRSSWVRCSDITGSCDESHETRCDAPQLRYNSHFVTPHLFSTVYTTFLEISPENQPPGEQLPEEQLPEGTFCLK